MKIRDILQKDRPTISFEVFPPKTMDNYASVEKATMKIAELQPDFMSITYGAGGGTSAYTIDIAANLMKTYNTPVLTHLTCVSSTKEMVHEVLGVVIDLARAGMTMAIVTHEMRFAEAVADRVVFLEGGLVVEESRPEIFFHSPETERARQFLQSFSYETKKMQENA